MSARYETCSEGQGHFLRRIPYGRFSHGLYSTDLQSLALINLLTAEYRMCSVLEVYLACTVRDGKP